MADSEEQLKRMVMTFRVSELQMLLGYAGKNKTGRKNELQSRALDIVRMRNPSIQQKIRELYKSIQLEMMSFGDRSQTAATGIMPAQRVPSGMNSIPSNYTQPGNVGGNLSGMSHSTTGYTSRNSSNQVSQVVPAMTTTGYNLHNSHNSNYVISPDVKLKSLPFYDIISELLKPSTLAPHGSGRYQEATFSFSLTPQQANKIAHSRDLRPGKLDYTIQVQMRFCLLETTCEQEDNFPPNITVKINDKMCPLPNPIPTNKPGVDPKRPSRPVNVTSLCRISPTVANRILVSWSSDYGRCYVISVYLVQKLTSDDLLQRLKSKGPRLADFTRSLIKQKLMDDSECEIATTSLRCSLLCPLGKMRMVLPCRAGTCIHLQCFDASLFLQMNERKPTWTCPVCDKIALYDTLVIDGYFQEVLQQNNTCTEVTLQTDGSWMPLIPKKEVKEQQIEKKKSEVAVETLSDDSDDEPESQTASDKDDSVIEEVRSKRKNPDVEIITLSDSDNECSSPASKRPAYQSSNSSQAPLTGSTSSSHSFSGNAGSSTAASGSGSGASEGAGLGDGTRKENASQEGATPGSECTKSNDSWHVGEVEPGKRLIFRKSLSSTSSGAGCGITTQNNAVTNSAASPTSSGSASPQIICLDSPASSPSPPSRQTSQCSSMIAPASTSSSAPTSQSPPLNTVPITAPPPYSTVNGAVGYSNLGPASTDLSSPASVAACLAPFGSELRPLNSPPSNTPPLSSSIPPVSITPVAPPAVSPSTLMAPTTTASSYLLQDPLANPTYITNNHYGLQSFLNPLSLIPPTVPPTTSANLANYRPSDQYL